MKEHRRGKRPQHTGRTRNSSHSTQKSSRQIKNTSKRIAIPPYAREELARRWEKAGIENDYLFAVVMRNPDIFLQLMQRILPELQLTRVVRHDIQHPEYAAPDAKSVRYDVYSDINGIQFVVEMQMYNSPDLVRRTRYYQSMLDIQNLDRGAMYRNLPDSFVIMICPFDLFGRGRHIYRFRNIDIRDKSLELGDGADKIFLNSHGTVDDISRELRNFLDLVNGKAPADSYCKQVADKVDEAKNNKKVKRMFMNVNLKQMAEVWEASEKARNEGHALGVAETEAKYADTLAAKDAEIERLKAQLAAISNK